MPEESSIYGTRSDQIHTFFRAKREWSKVKDEIVGKYVSSYLKTIHHRGRPIILVDAFSGPGEFGDGTKGSPVIICEAIERETRTVGVGAILGV